MNQKGDRRTVTIEKLVTGGNGLARVEDSGLVVFVPRTAPGDVVEVEITGINKNYLEAKVLQIHQPSPFRVSPPCAYQDRCGGCPWQQVIYEEQLRQKQQIVRESLAKAFPNYSYELKEIIPSAKVFRYRNRIQLQSINGKIGYFGKNSHDLVEIEDCLIAEEGLLAQLQESRKKPPRQRFQLSLSGEEGFSQVNRGQNENLIQWLLQETEKDFSTGSGEILDLYAGSGNLTFPMARKYSQNRFIAVELDDKAAKKAQEKVELESLQVEFHSSDVGRFLKSYKGTPRGVILDPPRVGCDEEIIQKLNHINSPVIYYISCNLQTFIRDMKRLSHYRLTYVQPLDMFPQTDHIEILGYAVPNRATAC